jgi:hypothetical protein
MSHKVHEQRRSLQLVAEAVETTAPALTLTPAWVLAGARFVAANPVAADAMTLPLSVRLLPMTFFDHDNH